MRQQKEERNYVWIFRGERIILKGKDICYVHTEQRKTFLHTRRKVYRIGGSLKEAEEKLGNLPLVRTHNAYLIHLDFLEAVSIRGAVLKDGTCLPVTENRWKKVREIVEDYCHSRQRMQDKREKLQKQTDFAQDGLHMCGNCDNLGA